MPHRVSHPDYVPVFAGLVQWLLWPGDPVAEWAGQENALLLGRIHQLHAEQDGVVGSPRIWEDLRYAGERCGRHRVARLCVELGVQGVPQRRRWRKQPTGTRLSETRNHLERDFTTAAPNTKWVTDITYIRTAEH